MKVSLSTRGLSTLAIAVALTLVAIASRDAVIACASVVTYIALILDIAHLSLARTRKPCTVHPKETKVRLWVGQRRSLKLYLRCSDVESVELQHPSLRIKEFRRSSRGEYELEILVEPRYSGLIKVEELRLLQGSKLGFFRIERSLAIDLVVEVLPRAWLLALVALALLSGRLGKALGLGFESTKPLAKSSTGVYYESREYQPGDPINRIDWKASSRLLKLIVKEFLEEGSTGALVVMDDRCLGPRTCDALASTLLSIAIASFANSTPISIYLESVGEYLELDPARALAFSIRKALEMTKVSELDPYELLEPLTPIELRELLHLEFLPTTRLCHYYELRKLVHPESRTLMITTLVVNASADMEIATLLKKQGIDVEIYTPRKPWLDLEDLEDAYTAYRTHRVVVEKLKRLGCVVKEVELANF